MNYTNGKWKISGVWGEDGYRIASIRGGLNLHIAGVDGRDENLDNARLIASAPDLYEALLAIMKAHGPGTLASDEIYNNAISAIAKAEGPNGDREVE